MNSEKHITTTLNAFELLRRDLCVSSLDNTFENFQQTQGTEKALEIMKTFTATFSPPMVLMYGGLGSGKTYLLEAAAIELREKGLFARVIKFERILAALRAGMKDRATPDYETVLDNYCQAKILLIDDYGMGMKGTEWAVSIFETIIDHRYHESLPTVVTTNIELTELPPRVYSRFMDKSRAVIVLNKGKDYRQRQ